MGFLVPAFLAGLAALAVPVWVHLRHRERKEPVVFPSLMFLRKIPFREVRRQQLHHLPLFLLRALAVTLLVLAFTRPFFRRADVATPAAAGAREMVVLLDRSWSMGYGDRWTRAVQAARTAIGGLAAGDQATVVVFDEDAAPATQAGAERASLEAALDTLRPGPRATLFAPALKVASEILSGSPKPRREVVLITDFQRSAWPERDEARLPAGTVLTRVDLSSGETPDLLIAGVELRRSATPAQELAPTARVVNRGTSPAEGVRVKLEVNGRVLEERTVRVGPGDVTLVPFGSFPLPEATSRATVSLPADALPADNLFHFTVRREEAVGVLLVSRLGGDESANLFLRRALALGTAPAVKLDVRRAADFRAADLAGAAVVVLNDVPAPGGDLGRRLAEFVLGGGGLLFVVGDGSGTSLGPDDISPGRAGTLVDRTGNRGGTFGAVERSHPIFELFQGPLSGDLSSGRFFRYRRLEPAAGTDVLARFDDGAPALVERVHGKGRVLALAAPLDNVWSDLPVQPVFLPLVHQITVHLAGWRETLPWHTVGQVVRLDGDRLGAITGEGTEKAVVVVSPSGQRRRVALEGTGNGSAMVVLDEPGLWEVQRSGVGGRLLTAVAANLDPAESDLRALDPEELAVAVAPASDSAAHAAAPPPAALEGRQRIWWYLLSVLALLLIAETVFANRLSGTVRAEPAVR